MITMSDKELEALKKRRLLELQRRMSAQEPKKEPIDAHNILNTIFKGRAWEVFNAAKAQFPSAMPKIELLLVKLALEGRIFAMEGEQLFALLKEVGLRVSLNTTIKVISHGETKTLSEEFKKSSK